IISATYSNEDLIQYDTRSQSATLLGRLSVTGSVYGGACQLTIGETDQRFWAMDYQGQLWDCNVSTPPAQWVVSASHSQSSGNAGSWHGYVDQFALAQGQPSSGSGSIEVRNRNGSLAASYVVTNGTVTGLVGYGSPTLVFGPSSVPTCLTGANTEPRI